MLVAETPSSSLDSAVQPTIALLERCPALFIERCKDTLIREITAKLQGYVPTQQVLDAYPFFNNIPKLIESYGSAIEVGMEGEEAVLRVNKEALTSKGLPLHLSDLLEYGNNVLPPFPHIRSTMLAIPSIIAEVYKDAGYES